MDLKNSGIVASMAAFQKADFTGDRLDLENHPGVSESGMVF
jgi:hypothetical protein